MTFLQTIATTLVVNLTLPLVAVVIGYELSFKASSLNKPLQTVALRLGARVLLALAAMPWSNAARLVY
jgi:hypothetical protein